jgi:hypothetical protein
MADPASDAVRILLFDGPQICVGNEWITHFPKRYPAALLTLMAVKPGQPIGRDEIADTLWPDELRNAIPKDWICVPAIMFSLVKLIWSISRCRSSNACPFLL